MLVCNVSLRPPRRAIAADVAEVIEATDATASGNIVFATLVDDPANVLDILDAYLGNIMLEAASAAETVDGSVAAIYAAAVVEAASATSTEDAASGAFTPASLTGLIGWWDASVTASLTLSGANITAVADQSGTGHTMNASGFANPTYNATGFNSGTKPAMMFGTGGSSFTASSFPMGTGNTLTIWYVGTACNPTGGENDGRALDYTAPGVNDYDSDGSWAITRNGTSNTSMVFIRNFTSVTPTTTAYPAPHRFICTINSSGLLTFYIDGVNVGTNTKSGNWVSAGKCQIGMRQAVGGGNGSFWSGPIAEAGVATGYSDATTVAQLDTYLKAKWGL